MRLTAKVAVLLCAAIPALPAVASAEARNWARDYVKQRERAAMERILGRAAAEALSAPTPYVIGGNLAPAGRWPFQAGLLLAGIANNYNAQYCGGSVIDEQFILTAAHCVDFLTAKKLHILTGTQSLAVGGTRRTVKAIEIHPKWNDVTFDYDIALVQLDKKIPNLPLSKRARMITRGQEAQLAGAGTSAFVTGWGKTGSGFPKELYQVSVPLVSQQVCNGAKSYDGAVTGRMVCAGLSKGGKDSCQGDSGGPLLVQNSNGSFRVQVGVVSWGTGCARPNFYGVYSRVAVLQSWVAATMRALR